MDLMAYVPHFTDSPNVEEVPIIVHNCEQPRQKDELRSLVRGNTFVSKLRRWCLRQRILSRKHPLTRWCLKSTSAVNYEITRHLRSYPLMIHPFSSFRVCWESVMTIFTFFALLLTPFFLTFYTHHHSDWHMFNDIINGVFISDIVVWFFTGYYDYRTKVIVLDHRIVATKYLKGSFVLDVLPVLPLELVESFIPQAHWYCSTLNMLKILRMRTIIIYSRRLSDVYRINFQLYKMLEMGVLVIMCVHWTACLEYYIPASVAYFSGVNNESWIQSAYMERKKTKLQKYLTCLHRAMIGLCSSTHYVDMKTPEDMIFNLICTVVGFLGFIYLLSIRSMLYIIHVILSSVVRYGQLFTEKTLEPRLLGTCQVSAKLTMRTQFSQLMTTFHSTSKKHFQLIQQLQEYMRHKELPQMLQRRLLIFYNYRNKKGFEKARQIINQVSPCLREELILHNYSTFVNSVEIFKHLPETVVTPLVSALRSEIFMAGDEIITAGARGDALYFIACGSVAVYTLMGKEVCHLEDGAYFGEIALVMESEHRIASVIAVETCEIYVLFRNDFLRLISPYPDLLSHLQNVALNHLKRTLLLEEAYNLKGSTSPKHINISSIKGKTKE